MICPRDGAQLAQASIDGVELEKCPDCAGVWLDYGELERVRQLHVTEVEGQLEDSSAVMPAGHETARHYMSCPKCSTGRLQQISYTYMQPIKIDRCEQCLGLWLDQSELDAILGEKRKLDEEFSVRRLRPFLRTVPADPHSC